MRFRGADGGGERRGVVRRVVPAAVDQERRRRSQAAVSRSGSFQPGRGKWHEREDVPGPVLSLCGSAKTAVSRARMRVQANATSTRDR
jgi:hypothetical protein